MPSVSGSASVGHKFRIRLCQVTRIRTEPITIANGIQIIRVLIGDGERADSRAQEIFKPMHHPVIIAQVRSGCGRLLAAPIMRSACASTFSLPSEVSRPSSNAAVRRASETKRQPLYPRSQWVCSIAFFACWRADLSNHIPATMQMLTALPQPVRPPLLNNPGS